MARSVMHLAPGECMVLACLAEDRTYKETALDLGISINSVFELIRRSYRKMQVNDRYAAVSTHRRMLRRTHRCQHLRTHDALITEWEWNRPTVA